MAAATRAWPWRCCLRLDVAAALVLITSDRALARAAADRGVLPALVLLALRVRDLG